MMSHDFEPVLNEIVSEQESWVNLDDNEESI